MGLGGRRGTAVVSTCIATCIAAVVLAGCGSDGLHDALSAAQQSSPSATAAHQEPTDAPSPTAPAVSTPRAEPSDQTGTSKSVDPCLLAVQDVGAVLEGTWKHRRSDQVCTYSSSRGAIFAISEVQDNDLQYGLDFARKSCDTKPREVRATSSFACIERDSGGDTVVGNIVAQQRLWLFLIIATGSGKHENELDAMTTLLRQVHGGQTA